MAKAAAAAKGSDTIMYKDSSLQVGYEYICWLLNQQRMLTKGYETCNARESGVGQY